MAPLPRPDELDALDQRIDAWLATQLEENPVVAAVDRDETPGVRRWFVRVRGEQKDTFSIWFHLQQRTLHYETYVMPAPYSLRLRRSRCSKNAAWFSSGAGIT